MRGVSRLLCKVRNGVIRCDGLFRGSEAGMIGDGMMIRMDLELLSSDCYSDGAPRLKRLPLLS